MEPWCFFAILANFSHLLINPICKSSIVAFTSIYILLNNISLYRARPFAELWEVYMEHLRRVWHADRGRLLLRRPDPVQFWTNICSNCWYQSFFPNLFFRTMLFESLDTSRFCFEHYVVPCTIMNDFSATRISEQFKRKTLVKRRILASPFVTNTIVKMCSSQ